MMWPSISLLGALLAAPCRPPSSCLTRLGSIVALADAPLKLASLRAGDALDQCEVTAAHNDKLFLAVPVVRDGRRGVPKPLHAQLNLLRQSPGNGLFFTVHEALMEAGARVDEACCAAPF